MNPRQVVRKLSTTPLFCSAALAAMFALSAPVPASAQEMMPATAGGWSAWAPRVESAPARDVSQSGSSYALNISGNQVPNVYGGWRARLSGLQGNRFYRFRARAVHSGITSLRQSVTIVLRWRGAFGDEVVPDYVWDYRIQADDSLLFDRLIQAPAGTTAVDVDLVLQWAPAGRVSFDNLSFTPTANPSPRPVRIAAVYFRPSGASSGLESVRQAAAYADQVAANHQPDVMVLGETLNVIGAPGTLDSKAETVPGPSTDILAAVARGHGINVAFGILEREGSTLYNTAVLLDRSGSIAGKYRKVQLPLSEASAGLAPGNSIPVFDADFGRVALLICQDSAFPEPVREAALQGAELVLLPIWGGKPGVVRARAAEHGIYVAASGYDYASEVIDPLGTVLAGVSSLATPGVAVADIDLSRRFRETWLGDWRDISNKERRESPYQRGIDTPPSTTVPPPPTDETPPVVSLTAPVSGATVSGQVTVTATASDNTGVARVRFFVDGIQLGADDTAAPYSVSWDTRTAPNGSHTIAATAFDAAGNSGTSSVTVNVSNVTPTGRPVPGTLEAEDYDTGGEGTGYHDTTPGNSGGQYRTDNVDIEATTDAGGGFNVGWMAAGEWLAYTVSVQAAGAYTLTARVAAAGAGGTFHLETTGGARLTGPLVIPDTGGWQAWTSVTATVTFAAGVQVLRFVADSAGPTGVFGNLNSMQLESAPTGRPVPGILQAEDYDGGGEGTGYHDTTPGNSGGQYRTDNVDIEATTDTGGGFNVGWMAAGEWLAYTVSVQAAGSYTFTARVAAAGAGGTFHLETTGGARLTGPLVIPNTGGWQDWTNVTASVTLPAGVQVLRFVADSAGPTGVFGNLNYIRLERTP